MYVNITNLYTLKCFLMILEFGINLRNFEEFMLHVHNVSQITSMYKLWQLNNKCVTSTIK